MNIKNSANDGIFDIKDLVCSLPPEQAIEVAERYIDQNCGALDAEYLKKAIQVPGDETVDLARTYATAGSAAAQVVCGMGKLQGAFMEQSTSEGLFWLRRAHNNGSTKASILLAGAYLDEKLIPRNAEKAAEYASSAAQKGDPAGQYIYANLLIEGEGVKQDDEAAVYWLQRSAHAGYERARVMLLDNGLPLLPREDGA